MDALEDVRLSMFADIHRCREVLAVCVRHHDDLWFDVLENWSVFD